MQGSPKGRCRPKWPQRAKAVKSCKKKKDKKESKKKRRCSPTQKNWMAMLALNMNKLRPMLAAVQKFLVGRKGTKFSGLGQICIVFNFAQILSSSATTWLAFHRCWWTRQRWGGSIKNGTVCRRGTQRSRCVHGLATRLPLLFCGCSGLNLLVVGRPGGFVPLHLGAMQLVVHACCSSHLHLQPPPSPAPKTIFEL